MRDTSKKTRYSVRVIFRDSYQIELFCAPLQTSRAAQISHFEKKHDSIKSRSVLISLLSQIFYTLMTPRISNDANCYFSYLLVFYLNI